MIRYGLSATGPHAKRLDMRKSAWTDAAGFRAIFHFFRLHRDQIPEIEWRTARDIPVHFMTKEPRVQCRLIRDWMARPLDLQRLLQDRVEAEAFDGRAEFSVHDEIIESNTGTYLVEKGKVLRSPRTAGGIIEMPLLSSLLFGGLTYSEAVMAGYAPPASLRDLFARRRSVWLSENF